MMPPVAQAANLAAQRRVVDAFLAASRAGDFDEERFGTERSGRYGCRDLRRGASVSHT